MSIGAVEVRRKVLGLKGKDALRDVIIERGGSNGAWDELEEEEHK